MVTVKFNGHKVSLPIAHYESPYLTNSLLQIKNIVSTAHAPATRRKSQVLVSHLREAVFASEGFIKEFNGGVDASGIFM